MFEPGEKVVCVNDTPVVATLPKTGPMRLVKGHIYTVQAFYPAGTRALARRNNEMIEINFLADGVAIGVLDPFGWDVWMATRFRKIIRRDISESLALLKGLKGLGPTKLVEA